jgi:hypothetical protein
MLLANEIGMKNLVENERNLRNMCALFSKEYTGKPNYEECSPKSPNDFNKVKEIYAVTDAREKCQREVILVAFESNTVYLKKDALSLKPYSNFNSEKDSIPIKLPNESEATYCEYTKFIRF